MNFRKSFCLLILLGVMWALGEVSAQSNCSYVIISNGGYTQVQIDQAFANASLDAYRFKGQRRTLEFANGAKVALLSSSELQANGCAVDASQAMEDHVVLASGKLFDIHPSGIIMEYAPSGAHLDK